MATIPLVGESTTIYSSPLISLAHPLNFSSLICITYVISQEMFISFTSTAVLRSFVNNFDTPKINLVNLAHGFATMNSLYLEGLVNFVVLPHAYMVLLRINELLYLFFL